MDTPILLHAVFEVKMAKIFNFVYSTLYFFYKQLKILSRTRVA